METLKDYLELVLPEEREGHHYFVMNFFEGSSRYIENHSKKSELINTIGKWQKSEVRLTREAEIFVGMSSFDFKGDEPARKKKYAVYNKAFFLDIDCEGAKAAVGEEEDGSKCYSSKKEAGRALQNFIEATGLPQPMIVSSGWGLHVYWILEKSIPSDDWLVYAKHLKKLAAKQKLNSDVSVTADLSRILRPIGTHNYKVPSVPKEVKLLRKGVVSSFSTLKNIFDNSKLGSVDGFEGLLDFDESGLRGLKDFHTDALAGKDIKFSWEKLKKRSLDDDGCGHVAFHLTCTKEEINKIKEPMWRAMVTLAALTEEKDQAVIELSRPADYEDFNEDDAMTKMAEFLKSGVGAHKCSTINELASEYSNVLPKLSKICKDCKYSKAKHKINSPLKLAVFVPENKDKDLKVTGKEITTDEKREYTIPDYPVGYLKHIEKSGIWIDNEEEQKCIYPNYIYPTARYEDPEDGVVMEISHHTAQQDVLHFMLPNKTLISNEECKRFLASHGVMTLPNDMLKVQRYLIEFSEILSKRERLKALYNQFGWRDNFTKFVVGQVVYDGDVASPNPPCSTMADLLKYYHKKGSMEKWKETFNLYNRPGAEVQAFTLMNAFAAPLMAFTNTKGIICHLTSSESGTGKTTVQRFINSVWGDSGAIVIQDDTANSRYHFIGVLNNLPVTLDEITNMDEEKASQLAYAITQGRTKLRMSSKSNKIRENTLPWNTILTTTGNSSLSDKIASRSKSPDGELARVFEMRMNSASAQQSRDARYDEINKNYGHAGPIYVQHIVKYKDEVEKKVQKMTDDIAEEFGIVGRERYMADYFGCIFAGCEISNNLGLHDYDKDWIKDFVRDVGLPQQRLKTESVKVDKLTHINEFMADHQDQILVADLGDNPNLNFDTVYRPKRLVGRVAPEADIIYLRASSFRSWCVSNRVVLDEVLEEAKKIRAIKIRVDKNGKEVYYGKIRMAKGTSGNSIAGAVNAYEFVASKITGFDEIIDKLTEETQAKN